MASIAFSGITKRFPGVAALSDVSFDVKAGSCHAICGENGAGKSTLGKILSGIERADAGAVLLDGQPIAFQTPRDALLRGVAIVHQELAACDNMTVAENLCLGRLPARFGIVNRSKLHDQSRAMLGGVGAEIAPDAPMASLSIAEQQLVQIATAVASGARALVLDEPTSSLAEDDVRRLFALIQRLRANGTTVIYISHRMREIFELCDAITVLRDGRHIATRATTETDEAELVRLMIGRPLSQYFPAHSTESAHEERLRVDRLSRAGAFQDVSFSLRAGEVVGLAGLVGAGRSEIAESIFGLAPASSGTIHIREHPTEIRSPRDAMRLGIGLVPEDRKRQGLVLSMCASENSTLTTLGQLARFGWIDRVREREQVHGLFQRLGVRARPEVIVSSLSGGNQQKVVMAKWLAAKSDILMLDEPTRGVDVGAKAELHAWIDELASRGCAVLLISSELPELIALSSRILVLRNGRLAGEVSRGEASQDLLLRMMTGLSPSEA